MQEVTQELTREQMVNLISWMYSVMTANQMLKVSLLGEIGVDEVFALLETNELQAMDPGTVTPTTPPHVVVVAPLQKDGRRSSSNESQCEVYSDTPGLKVFVYHEDQEGKSETDEDIEENESFGIEAEVYPLSDVNDISDDGQAQIIRAVLEQWDITVPTSGA